MQFVFMAMGNYDAAADRAVINENTRMIGVRSLEQACAVAKELQAEGVGCIELCGAFGPEGARAVIEATGGTLPVGYVVHFPEQDGLFAAAFPNDKQ